MSEETHPAWWNPWHWPTGVWMLVIGLGLMFVPFGIRAVRLAGVPAMDEPFDVDEFVKWDVPEAENAFTEYRQATDMRAKIVATFMARSGKEPENADAVITQGWSTADESLKEWLDANREVLAVWRRGTGKQHALYISPANLNFDTQLSVVQEQRAFVRLAMLEHTRALDDGNLDEAWQWVRAVFRSGGHTTHRSCFIQGNVGLAIHSMSTKGMARWAERSAVSVGQLKQAIFQTKADYTLYESESNIFKAEYLTTRNTLLTPHWFEAPGASNAANSTTLNIIRRMGLWVVGEPDVTGRVARQVLANQIRELDKPVSARWKAVGSGKVVLFDTDPTIPLAPRQLDASAIDRCFAGSWLARIEFLLTKDIDNAMLRHRARQATTEAMLSVHAYHRAHGEFPKSLAQVVPDYLESVPLDPCDPSGGPLLYRRDEASKAVVWSVGDDGIDNGGAVAEVPNTSPADVGFTLKIAR